MGFEQSFSTTDLARAGRRSGVVPRFAILLLLLIGTGIAVRFYGIGSRSLWLDEAYSGWFNGLGWLELWTRTPEYEPHPPFYYSLLKVWSLLLGDSAAALRGLSATAGALSVLVMLGAARELSRLVPIERRLFFIATLCALMALSPRLIVAAQDARPYALQLLAYATAIWGWLRLTRGFRSEPGSAGAIADWAILGVATCFVLWLHALGILFGAALLVALLLTARDGASRPRWLRLWITVCLCGVSYVPCLAMMAARTGDWGSGWLGWDPGRFPGQLMNLYGQLMFDEPVSPILAALIVCALLAVSMWLLWSRGDRSMTIGLAFLILFPPLASALISQLAMPVFLPRTMLAVSAPAYLVAALGLAQLSAPQRHGVASLLAVVLAANLVQAVARPAVEPWERVAAILKRQMQPGDVIWVYPNDLRLPLERALAREMPVTSIPAPFPAVHVAGHRVSGSPAVVALDGPMARAWARNNPAPPEGVLWLVTGKSHLFDPTGDVVKALTSGRKAGPRYREKEIGLQAFHPQ